jgi:predicted DNA-binding transcriptional regulator AlpA
MGSKPNIIEPLAPLLTKQQVPAFLNVRPWTVDRFRRDDKCFPQPRWLSDGTPRWLPHELHNWVNSRTSRRPRPRGSGTINNNSADDGVRGSENERREQCRAVSKGSG